MRLLGRILLIALAAVGGLTLLLTLSLFWVAGREHQASLPRHMVLMLDLNDGVSEGPSPNVLARLNGRTGHTLREVVETLDRAARDPAVDGLVARLDDVHLGMAKAQEIRDAVRNFRNSGKRTAIFSSSLGEFGGATLAYYIATAFQEIWMQPSGDLGLTGFVAQSPFIRNTLDMLGVKAEFGARWEYKSAIDMFTQTQFTKENRDSLQLLVDSWARQAVEGIGAARGLAPEAVRALMDRAPLLGEEARQARLVDHLAYWDELEKSLTEGGAKLVDLSDYTAHLRPEANAVKVALIYGVGEVTRGGGKEGPFGEEAGMAADRIVKAFADAAKDPRVKAILFRIDSPGGSYTAADSIWRAVGQARAAGKPVIVSMGDLAASGGYFAAMPADKIVAQPGTITGSIGVFAGKMVLADLYKKLGIGFDQVQVGQNAAMFSTTQGFSPQAWERLNAILDHIYADFTGKAAQGRHLKPEDMDKIARGRIWPGEQAKALGLVDELGGFSTALGLVRQVVRLPSQMPIDLQPFPKPKDPLQIVLDLLQSSGESAAGPAESLVLARRLERLAEILEPLTAALDRQEQPLRLPPLRLQ